MNQLTFGEQLKIVLGRKGMTIKELAELIEEKTGKKMSRQNMTQRLGRDNFQEQDMRMIASILECDFSLNILSASEGSVTSFQQRPELSVAKEPAKKPTLKVVEKPIIEFEKRQLEVHVGDSSRANAQKMAKEITKEVVEQEAEKIAEEVAVQEAEEIEEEIAVQKAEEIAEEIAVQEVEEIAEEIAVQEVEETAEPAEPAIEEVTAGPTTEPVRLFVNPKNDEEQEEFEIDEGGGEDITIGELKDMHRELTEMEKEAEFREKGVFLRVNGVPVTPKEQEEFKTKESEVPSYGQNQEKDSLKGTEELEEDIESLLYAEKRKKIEEAGGINPHTGVEYETNTVKSHPTRIGYVQVYDRAIGRWKDMTEWAFIGYQERKKAILGPNYDPPVYLD